MSPRRAAIVGGLVALAVLLQVTLVTRWSLPGGGPALVVLVVAVVASREGPLAGMLVGAAGGLLADFTPPSDTRAGQSMLVLVVVGELVGLMRRRSAGLAFSVLLVGLGTLLAGSGLAAFDALFGRDPGGPGSLLTGLAATAAYNVALAIPALGLAGARLHPSTGHARRPRHRSLRLARHGRRLGGSVPAGGWR